MKKNHVTVKQKLDEVFRDVKFDKALFKKIRLLNTELILKQDNKNLFGSRLVGCQSVKYVLIDKDRYFSYLFDLDYSSVEEEIKKITTIPNEFKVSRDSINLTIFYSVHRVLNSKDLNTQERKNFALELFNYFNYRTLIVLCSSYFIYPISQEEAISLVESLSNRYIIKKLNNWNEYCKYRSNEFLESKFYDDILRLNDDKALPNIINDLFIRTKSTIKNIYSQFIVLNESDAALKKRKSVVSDLEGEEVLVDKINHGENVYIKVVNKFTDRNSFISSPLMDVTVHIIRNLSYDQLSECLNNIFEYAYKKNTSYKDTTVVFNKIITYSLEYLQRNNKYVTGSTKIIDIVNVIVGNILYARSLDKEIDDLKEDIVKLIKTAYKEIAKESVSNKALNNLKNGLFVYVLLRGLID